MLTEEGLRAAVETLIDRTPIPVRFRAPDRRWPPAAEATAFFVVAESITNVVKHAQASSIDVRIDDLDGRLRVEVSDDGIGGAVGGPGTGLTGLDDRVAAAGGTLVVLSEAGNGTSVRAEIPIA